MKNEMLFKRVKSLVATERRIGVEILECLYEIEMKKAYAELKYDGLYTFCVKELGFSDFEAYQRIQAMYAMQELPELKPMIESGSLPVSSISKVQVHLRKESVNATEASVATPSREEKLEVFKLMENRTTKEVARKIAELQGKPFRQKLVLELDEETFALWNQVKGLAAHRTGGQDAETLRILAQEWLKRNDPTREVRSEKVSQSPIDPQSKEGSNSQRPSPSRRSVPLSGKVTPQEEVDSVKGTSEEGNPGEIKRPTQAESHRKVTHDPLLRRIRFIPATLKREVWRRDQSQCRKCHSTHALEIDHIIPVAKGGLTEIENLRLLCRSCNQAEAIRIFGERKMRRA